MSVVTGKSGKYRYYKCNARMNKGDTACPSKNFPLDKIDNLVLNAFRDKIYTPEHIRDIIDGLRDSLSKKGKGATTKQKLKALEVNLKETETAQPKLFEAVEKGILDLDDQLKERAKQHKQSREALISEITELKRQP